MRNTQLDGLRGVAILLVIGVHLHFAPPPGFLGYLAHTWERVGHVGVDLFFVLSGFLIGSLLITEMQTYGKLDVPRFLIRRGFKLYPMYYVFMMYCIVVPAIKHSMVSRQNGWATLVGEFSSHLPSLAFLQNYWLWDSGEAHEGHTWTLAVEEHFYFLLPLVIAVIGPKRIGKWLIPICLWSIPVCLALRSFAALRNPPGEFPFGQTHLRVDALLFGVALSVTALTFPEIFTKWGRRPRPLIAGGVFLWFAAFLPFWPEILHDSLGYTARLLGSAAILVGACNIRKAEPGKVKILLAWIGVNSYGIYMWHVTGIGMMEKSVGRVIHDHITNQNLQWVLLASTIVVFCVTLGAVATRLVERPSLSLRDRLWPSRGKTLVVPAWGDGS